MAESQVTELVVARHGETVRNQTGVMQGWLDSPLSELGLAQAAAMAEALAGERFDALYSSDLGRAMQTAEIIAEGTGLETIPEPRLRERNLGIMQGMTSAEFGAKHPDEHAAFGSGDSDYCVPDGESARQRHQRTVGCVEEIASRHGGQRVLIVTHGGVLNGLFRRAVGLGLAAPRRYSLLNASISTFTVANGHWKLERWGDTHHLKALETKDDW